MKMVLSQGLPAVVGCTRPGAEQDLRRTGGIDAV